MLFVLIFFATMLTYPVFACVNAPIPIVGYCLGALYTDLLWVPDDVFVLLLLITKWVLNTDEPSRMYNQLFTRSAKI